MAKIAFDLSKAEKNLTDAGLEKKAAVAIVALVDGIVPDDVATKGDLDKQSDRITQGFEQQNDRIERSFKDQNDRIERGFKEQDDRTEQRFKEQDDRIERGFKEQNDRIERGFKEQNDRTAQALKNQGDRAAQALKNQGDRAAQDLKNQGDNLKLMIERNILQSEKSLTNKGLVAVGVIISVLGFLIAASRFMPGN